MQKQTIITMALTQPVKQTGRVGEALLAAAKKA